MSANAYTVQIVGNSDKLDAFIQAVAGAEILEVVRSGVSGLSRGKSTATLSPFTQNVRVVKNDHSEFRILSD